MLKVKNNRVLLSILVSSLVLVSFATFAYATSKGYDTNLPSSSVHATIVNYVERTTTSYGMNNSNTISQTSMTRVNTPFISWVDQESVGPVTADLKLNEGDNKPYNMRAYPVAGQRVRARARSENVLSATLYVKGTINFN